MNSGIKQRFNLINLNENGIHEDCSSVTGNEVTVFSELQTEAGKSVGIISTARLTHATPAAVYAKTANRNWEDSVPEDCTAQKDIASQLIDAMEAGTIDFAMGGGGRHFLPADFEMGNLKGRRKDGENLIEKATGLGAQFASDTESFNALDLAADSPILALYENSHMQYNADRTDEPSLAEMTKSAIEYLSKNENGFYLEIEAGRVDHASHAGNAYRTLTDGLAFIDAVKMADELTNDEDTLIIVTADHEHAIAFNGYCGRGSDITGLCMGVAKEGDSHSGEPLLAKDGKPYTVIGFLNGTGSVLREDVNWVGARPDLTQDDATDMDYIQQALIPTSSETHSGEDVAVYAKGPWAHLFDGTIEQNVIFHVMNHAVNAE
ncbi:alkaline phosphatase [Phaeobacter sp. J2-8]|uniref:alkaline phosphatase n=1 Tax=Phaeobacter sp. J2-8 TaxID=2931394 RepID=UPI0032AF8886